MRCFRRSILLVLAAIVLVGCGGQRAGTPASSPVPSEAPAGSYAQPAMEPPSSTMPGQAPAAPPTSTADQETLATLEQAEAALARARHELDSLLATESESAGMAPPAPSRSPAPRASDEKKANGAASEQADSRCANACRAFASLERAADAVCRLAGQSNDRCTQARRLVTTNQDRVKSCGCMRGNR